MSRDEFKNIKILYVEDEDYIRENAISYLKRLFDYVYEAKNAKEALLIKESKQPHIIISDIKMPDMTGLEMVKKIRETDTNTQIIILSAHSEKEYLFEAIELGLVKYLIKPIRHDIIYPILQECAKKIYNTKKNKIYIDDNIYFDLLKNALYINNNIVKLTKRENSFLHTLAQNPNEIVSYDLLQIKVWEESLMSEDAIRSVVRNLRKKLPVDCIENFSKVGYKLITN